MADVGGGSGWREKGGSRMEWWGCWCPWRRWEP